MSDIFDEIKEKQDIFDTIEEPSLSSQEINKALTGSMIGQVKYTGQQYPGMLQFPPETIEFMGYGEAPLTQQPIPQTTWEKMRAALAQGENMQPGFIGTMLNPAEIAAMAATGGLTAPKGQVLKEMLDWALYGAPSITRGVIGGGRGLLRGLSAKAIESRVPVEKAMPTAISAAQIPPSTTAQALKSVTQLTEAEKFAAPALHPTDLNKPEVLDAFNSLLSTQREQMISTSKLPTPPFHTELISSLKTLGLKGLTPEVELKIRSLPQSFISKIKSIRHMTPDEVRAYHSNALFFEHNGVIAVEKGANVSSFLHEVGHSSVWPNVTKEDRLAIIRSKGFTAREEAQDEFSAAFSEYVLNSSAFSKRDPMVQRVVEKYSGADVPEQLRAKFEPKYKAPWGGRFEPRNYDVTPDYITKSTLQTRAQQLNSIAAKEADDYITKLNKMSQIEGAGKITEPSTAYQAELDRLMEAESNAIKKIQPTITPEDLITSGVSPDLNPLSILKSEKGATTLFSDMIQGLRSRGIVGPEFPNPKDFHSIYKYLQLPHDIAKSHPSFKPIFDAEMAREATRNAQVRRYYEITKPYFELASPADRAVVDRALLLGDKLRITFDHSILQRLNLTPSQISAYDSITKGTSAVLDDLADGMRRHGVDQNTINEFVTNLRDKGFVPHKWYGKYGVVVQEPGLTTYPSGGALGAPHTARNKTIYVSARESKEEASLEFNRLTTAYPGKIVKLIKRDELERLASFDVPPYAIQALIDKAAQRAGTDPVVAQELSKALHDLRLAKGMGAHFIKRKWTPGYEENLERPLAEYFMGMSGYIAKIDAMNAFTEGLKAVKTPNLRKYAIEYIESIVDPKKHDLVNIAKSLMFHYHLGTNLKFGIMNLTQNAITGYPILGKYTSFPAPKYMKAMSDVALKRLAPDEIQAIKFAKDNGLLETKFIHEALVGKGDPFLHHGKLATITDISSFIPNITEDYNRVSAFVAGYRALRDRGPAGATGLPMRGTGGARVPGSLPDLAKGAADISNEIHFLYGKGDRPALARGVLSPIMTFRLFGINYITMLKNFMKESEWAALARSMGIMTGLAGAGGYTGFNIADSLYMHFTGQDLKSQTRDWVSGKAQTVMPKEWGDRLAVAATDGLPAAVGPINMSRSLGMGDLVPIDPTGVIGVFGGQYEKAAAGYKAYQHKDYYRMFESIAPQFVQSPMSAYRLATEGARNIAGQQLLDPSTGKPIKISTPSAIFKGAGFQPVDYAEATRKINVTFQQQERINSRGLKAAELAAGAINRGETGRALQILNTAIKDDPQIGKVAATHLNDWIGPKLPTLIRYQVDKALHGSHPPNMP